MSEPTKEQAYSDGFDAGQNEALFYFKMITDSWWHLPAAQQEQIRSIAPVMVEGIEKLKLIADVK